MILSIRNKLIDHLGWLDMGHTEKTRFLTLALAGEAGEMANIVKKEWRGDGPIDRHKLEDELADVLNYAHMLAVHLEIVPEIHMARKLRIAEERREINGGA